MFLEIFHLYSHLQYSRCTLACKTFREFLGGTYSIQDFLNYFWYRAFVFKKISIQHLDGYWYHETQ